MSRGTDETIGRATVSLMTELRLYGEREAVAWVSVDRMGLGETESIAAFDDRMESARCRIGSLVRTIIQESMKARP